MSYTSEEKVLSLCALLPQELTQSTPVTADGLAAIMAQVDAEIDTAFSSLGYTVPVTAPAYLVTWLDMMAAEGSAARLIRAWYQGGRGTSGEGAAKSYEERYGERLKMIQQRRMIPTELSEPAGALPSVTLEVDGSPVEPIFKVGQVW